MSGPDVETERGIVRGALAKHGYDVEWLREQAKTRTCRVVADNLGISFSVLYTFGSYHGITFKRAQHGVEKALEAFGVNEVWVKEQLALGRKCADVAKEVGVRYQDMHSWADHRGYLLKRGEAPPSYATQHRRIAGLRNIQAQVPEKLVDEFEELAKQEGLNLKTAIIIAMSNQRDRWRAIQRARGTP